MEKRYVLHDSGGKPFYFTDKEKFERAARNLAKLDQEYRGFDDSAEQFLSEMGTGRNAWRLPAPYWKEYDNG